MSSLLKKFFRAAGGSFLTFSISRSAACLLNSENILLASASEMLKCEAVSERAIANRRHHFQEGDEEHAVFLSENEPLVTVLREALTRDQVEKKKCIVQTVRPEI